VNLPELSADKLDNYARTGLKLLIVAIVGSIFALPFDTGILLLQGGALTFTSGIIGTVIVGGLAILSLIVRLIAAGYAAKWLYNWE